MANSRSSVLSSSKGARPKRLLGSEEPRIFTPPLRKLTAKTSLGFAAIEFSQDVCGIELYPWQRWLLVHALELIPDGSFRFRNIVVLVARQNGKSTLSQVLSLFFLYILGTDLVLGTAQDLDTAEEVWDGALDIIEDTPELAALADKPIKVNGKKTIRLKTGERYKVKAANRRAGRGLSGDLVLLDELREHQSWDAWGAITKTTMARPNAQVWALSNAGDATSVVLRYLRKMAHAGVGDPDGINATDDPAALLADDIDTVPDDVEVDADETLGLFEWSAPPGCEVWDHDGWALANPSLGHGQTTERAISSACKTDPEWVFRTEVLCQWTDGTLEGPFPPGTWDAGRDPESRVAAHEPVTLCVDVSWDRSMTHVGLAGRRDDGKIHLEVIASRAGTDWVVPWLTASERSQRVREASVAVQASASPVASLVEPLRAAYVSVIEWKGADLGAATGAFYDGVRADLYRHRAQPNLDVAAATAVTRPLTDAYVWDRKKSPTDISPLIAVTGAAWFLNDGNPDPQVHEWPTDDEMDDWEDE